MRVPTGGPNSFSFMQFLGKFWQNRMLAPPGELMPPPQGNPGSTTAELIFKSKAILTLIILVLKITMRVEVSFQ